MEYYSKEKDREIYHSTSRVQSMLFQFPSSLRQRKRERAPFADNGFHPDLPAIQFDDFLDDCEADPGAFKLISRR